MRESVRQSRKQRKCNRTSRRDRARDKCGRKISGVVRGERSSVAESAERVTGGKEVASIWTPNLEKLGNEDLIEALLNHDVTTQKYLNMDD